MKPSNYFTKENGYYYVDSRIINLAEEISIPKKIDSEIFVLSRNMNDKEILEEIKPTRVSVGEIASFLKTADKSKWYLFYPKENESLVVRAFWDAAGGAWSVRASEVGSPYAWGAGCRVVSSKLTLSPSDPVLEIKPEYNIALALNNLTTQVKRLADYLEPKKKVISKRKK